MEQSNKKQLFITLAVLLAIVAIVGGAVAFGKKKSANTVANTATDTGTLATNTTDTTLTSSDISTATTPTSTTSSTYKDGTYNATGNFDTPESSDSIQVSITIKNGVISDTSATATAHARESQEYDSAFINSYKSYVVGQKIDTIYLNRLSGASLTSQGFNNALEQIKTQAQA